MINSYIVVIKKQRTLAFGDYTTIVSRCPVWLTEQAGCYRLHYDRRLHNPRTLHIDFPVLIVPAFEIDDFLRIQIPAEFLKTFHKRSERPKLIIPNRILPIGTYYNRRYELIVL